ncbi:MAG TPA: rod shape-determining protein MreC [Acidimicrobiia bacterium]
MNRRPRSDFATQMMIGLVIVSFLAMTFDIQTSGQGLPGTLRSGARRLFTPLQAVAAGVVDPVVDFVDGAANLAGLRDENAVLRQTIVELQGQLSRAQVDAAELASLQALLALSLPDESLVTTFARVIAGGDTFDLSFTIDKGTNQGVLVGNPVLDQNGQVVGTVTESFATTAVVAPVVDPIVSIPVRTASGMTGMSQGMGEGIRLTFLDAQQPVLADELVLTAGSDRYPPDLPVAAITTSVLPEAGTRVIRVEAVPLSELDRLRFVVVVQWPVAEEVSPTQTTTETTVPPDTTAPADSEQGAGDG